MNERSNNILIRRLSDGDLDALKPFYLNNKDYFCSQLLKRHNISREQAEEYYQESILIFYEKIRLKSIQIKSQEPVNYLIGIGNNLVRKAFQDPTFYETDINYDPFSYLPDDVITEEDRAYYEELVKISRESVDELGETCKKLLTGSIYHKLSTKELAEQLNFKNTNTVKSKKTRCIKQLRKIVLHKVKVQKL